VAAADWPAAHMSSWVVQYRRYMFGLSVRTQLQMQDRRVELWVELALL
jgi:hypothetical protein